MTQVFVPYYPGLGNIIVCQTCRGMSILPRGNTAPVPALFMRFPWYSPSQQFAATRCDVKCRCAGIIGTEGRICSTGLSGPFGGNAEQLSFRRRQRPRAEQTHTLYISLVGLGLCLHRDAFGANKRPRGTLRLILVVRGVNPKKRNERLGGSEVPQRWSLLRNLMTAHPWTVLATPGSCRGRPGSRKGVSRTNGY